jgi:hypothetical protein
MNYLGSYLATNKDTFLGRTLVNPTRKLWGHVKNTVGGVKMFLHLDAREIENAVPILPKFPKPTKPKSKKYTIGPTGQGI